MAAWDTFESFAGSLSQQERDALKDSLRNARSDLFAARSEEARIRIAADFISSVHELLKPQKK